MNSSHTSLDAKRRISARLRSTQSRYTVNGGDPIFIDWDWQYARSGQGSEDIVFLLVESCDISDFANLSQILNDSYYNERQKLDDVTVPKHERRQCPGEQCYRWIPAHRRCVVRLH